MPAPYKLDEIDLGPQKREIIYGTGSVLWIVAMVIMGLLSCGAGIGIFGFGQGGRPGTDDTKVVIILTLAGGALMFLLAIMMTAIKICSMNERILVFKDGICWEHWSTQECYRWKDIEKIVWYSADTRVYWLYFKSGRKVVVSLLGGVKENDWAAFRRLLEKKVPDKWVDES